MPTGEADRWSHARPLPDPCVGRARAASTGAALAAGSSLLGDSQDARSHHRAPGLKPGGGASRLHRLPAIPDAQLAAAFRLTRAALLALKWSRRWPSGAKRTWMHRCARSWSGTDERV